MTTFCTSCGAQLEPGKAFCGTCGTPVDAKGKEQAGTTPTAAAAAAAPAAAAPATSTPARAEAPAQPPTTATPTPPQPLSVPAPATLSAPRPSGGGGGKGKTGLIVGSAVALVAAFAGFKFFTGGPDPVGPGPDPDPTPTIDPQPDPTVDPDPDPDPDPPDPEPDPVPPDDPLLDIIATNVGPFTLDQISEFPELIEIGAHSAYQMGYVGPAGNVYHSVAAYPSPEDAQGHVVGFANHRVESGGYQVVDQGTVEIAGEEAGIFAYLTDGQFHVIVWSNGFLWAIAEAGSQQTVNDFWGQLPY